MLEMTLIVLKSRKTINQSIKLKLVCLHGKYIENLGELIRQITVSKFEHLSI